MDIREYLIDILLTTVMIISTLVLINRFWQDLTIAIAATLKMRHLERSIVLRERILRNNLEEISRRMAEKIDMSMTHLDELIGEYSKRIYR
jgi:hypothetical protein